MVLFKLERNSALWSVDMSGCLKHSKYHYTKQIVNSVYIMVISD